MKNVVISVIKEFLKGDSNTVEKLTIIKEIIKLFENWLDSNPE